MTAERPGTPGAGWERELRRYTEVVVPEDGPSPFAWDEPGDGEYRPNRATRRAVGRAAGRKGARMKTDTLNTPTGPQTGTESHDD